MTITREELLAKAKSYGIKTTVQDNQYILGEWCTSTLLELAGRCPDGLNQKVTLEPKYYDYEEKPTYCLTYEETRDLTDYELMKSIQYYERNK